MTADRGVSVARWLDALREERELRRASQSGGVDDPRERLIAELDLMAQRMRTAPDWREPTPKEQEVALAEIMRWFRDHGYMEEDGKHLKPFRAEQSGQFGH